jgi:hydroxymethylpyrimidine pyrophosphatase-like HAD family hydrolase
LARSLVGIAFDVDDTITRHGRLEEPACAALWRLVHAGVRLAACTGRPLVWARTAASLLPIDLAVAENGGAWVRAVPGSPRVEGFYDPEPARMAQRAVLHQVFERLRHEIADLRISDDGPERLVDLTLDAPGRTLTPAEVARIGQAIQAVGGRCLVSSVQVHITLCPADKASGLRRAAGELLGIDLDAQRSHWIFIGDSPNDAEAFAYFEHSVGVANIEPFLPQISSPPRYLTRSDRGLGFAELADQILAARSSSHTSPLPHGPLPPR